MPTFEGAVPEVRYARSGRHHLAYQVFGEGPVDLVFAPNWAHNVEVIWERPAAARFLRRLASFARVVLFDRRGSGLSDPVGLDETPTLDDLVEDAIAVMDDAGAARSAFLTTGLAAGLGLYLAATHPDRIASLILYNATARVLRAPDYSIGMPLEVAGRTTQTLEDRWGRVPPWGLEQNGEWGARWQRLSLAPGAAAAAQRLYRDLDLRALLPLVRTSALVLHTIDNPQIRLAHGQYLATHLPDAHLVELPGAEVNWYWSENELLADEIQHFLTGTRGSLASSLAVATILFTDVVGSTERAAVLGDDRWRNHLDLYFSQARELVASQRGRFIKTTGDGIVATFDSATRAVHCALELERRANSDGLAVRAGLHTGEFEHTADGDIVGIAVHVAARVASAAGENEIVTTGTLKDLLLGSPIEFVPYGTHHLKGVPGEWTLWQVAAGRGLPQRA